MIINVRAYDAAKTYKPQLILLMLSKNIAGSVIAECKKEKLNSKINYLHI